MQEHADPEAVRVELQAQVERALKAGIDVTHVDTHMGTVAQLSQQLEAQGLPLFDQMVAMPLDESADRVQVAKKLFERILLRIGRLQCCAAWNNRQRCR